MKILSKALVEEIAIALNDYFELNKVTVTQSKIELVFNNEQIFELQLSKKQ